MSPSAQDEYALAKITLTDKKPTLTNAAAALGVAVKDIDPIFGVVPIDPSRSFYSVLVRADKLRAAHDGDVTDQGPYSNPPISPIGSPKPPGK